MYSLTFVETLRRYRDHRKEKRMKTGKRCMIAIFLMAVVFTSLAGCSAGYEDRIRTGGGETASVSGAAASNGEILQDHKQFSSGNAPVFEDGMAQPILTYSNLRDEDYTNEGSDILRYCVYIETDHDTDSDGKADLVEALVQVPRAAAEGSF